jgi:translation initiation factor 2B subunit (eIF-2B alpha/beta/delta family)
MVIGLWGGGSSVDIALAHAIAGLAADSRSGAAQIAARAADILLRRAGIGEAASPDAFRQELLATGWAIIQAQPAMAPLVNLVNSVMWKIEERETPTGLRQAVAEATDHFKRQLRHHSLRVAEDAIALIGDGATLVTLSYSTTVQHALLYAHRAGRRFSVICAESRPACEGRETAAMLAANGIPVKIIVDFAAVVAVPTANLVLVGADLLSRDGLVNKVGTRALALAAQASGVPVYTLCSSEKFLPPGYPTPEQRQWPLEEIWADAPRGVGMHNYYFDLTPLELITGIVTEQGVLPTAAIEAWLAATKLHPALATNTLLPAVDMH